MILVSNLMMMLVILNLFAKSEHIYFYIITMMKLFKHILAHSVDESSG